MRPDPRACIVGGSLLGVGICAVATRGELRALVLGGDVAAYATLATTVFTAALACALLENAKRGEARVAAVAALLAVGPFVAAAIGLVLRAREVAALASTHLERSIGSFFFAAASEVVGLRTLGAGLVVGTALGTSAALALLRAPSSADMETDRMGAASVTLGIAMLAALILLDNAFVTVAFRAFALASTDDRTAALVRAARASHRITTALRGSLLVLGLGCILVALARARQKKSAFSVLCALVGALSLFGLDAATVHASTRGILGRMPLGESSALEPVPFAHEYITDAGTHCLAYPSRLACERGAEVPYGAEAVPPPRTDGLRSARRTLSVAFDARVRAAELRIFFRAARAEGYRTLVVHGGVVPPALAHEDVPGFLRLLVLERSAFYFHLDAGAADADLRARAVTHAIRDDDSARTFLLRARASRTRYTQRFVALRGGEPPL